MKVKTLQLGFLGVGWIGLNRLEAVARAGLGEIQCIADPAADKLQTPRNIAPDATYCSSYEELLDQEVDGVVIATPSALHASQSLDALRREKAVFCQKPLGRTARETAAVVRAARKANLLLGVDFSYRFTCYRLVHELVQRGELGDIVAVELCFHNAYGPDKPWFYDRSQSGGGCVIDLGVHLLDLALWTLNQPEVEVLSSLLYAQGKLLTPPVEQVEDHAVALMKTRTGTALSLTCSWNLPAGREAEIYVKIYGTRGGAAFRNLNGSFYDFEVARFHGTRSETLFSGPDEWGGRAVVDWTQKLADGLGFDPAIESVVQVANLIDQIYGRD